MRRIFSKLKKFGRKTEIYPLTLNSPCSALPMGRWVKISFLNQSKKGSLKKFRLMINSHLRLNLEYRWKKNLVLKGLNYQNKVLNWNFVCKFAILIEFYIWCITTKPSYLVSPSLPEIKRKHLFKYEFLI